MSEKPAPSLNQLTGQLSGEVFENQEYPPVDRWNPEFCGDIDLVIKRNGEWLYNQSPITRPAMVKLFARVLWREGDEYYLKTPVEKVGIQVEETPFHVVAMTISHGETRQVLSFTTLTGDTIVADSEHPVRFDVDAETGEPKPLILVRFGMEALINRPVFYELVACAEPRLHEGRDVLAIKSKGHTFLLGDV